MYARTCVVVFGLTLSGCATVRHLAGPDPRIAQADLYLQNVTEQFQGEQCRCSCTPATISVADEVGSARGLLREAQGR